MSVVKTARLKLLVGIVLSVLAIVSYWGVVENDFIRFDDPLYVTENPWVQRGLNAETVLWAFTTSSQARNWHPLTWLSLMLDRELFGLNPAGYHWTSVLLHLLGGLLLFAALNRMTASLWGSGLVAALFLIHPLHVESVAWVAERKDVLSGVFWMGGLWCYARYAERPGLARYLWVVLAFACGLMSKPMVVTFPFVLLLLDWWPLRRRDRGKANWVGLAVEKIPLFLLSAAASGVTLLVQTDAIFPLSVLPFGDRLANAVVSYAAYLGKMFWPAGISVFYPYHGPPPFGQLFASLLPLILTTVFSVLLLNRRPYLLVGWLWYLGTLVPVVGLVQVGLQAMADRYTYLPLVGIFIMTVWGASDLLESYSGNRVVRGFASAAAAGILILLVIQSQDQIRHWKDSSTLFTQALRNTERNFMAYHILAEEMVKRGELADAEKHYREAIRIRPDFKLAYNGLGYLMMISGKQGEAGALLETALQLDPAYVPAMKNLGDVRMRQGRIEDAVPLYREALLFRADDPELLNNYGVALYFKGEVEAAAGKFRRAVYLKPDYTEARENLKKILQSGNVP
jgi:Tfp pilus assembly protein PilF